MYEGQNSGNTCTHIHSTHTYWDLGQLSCEPCRDVYTHRTPQLRISEIHAICWPSDTTWWDSIMHSVLFSPVVRDLTLEYIFYRVGKKDTMQHATYSTDYEYTLVHASLLTMKVWKCAFMYYSIASCAFLFAALLQMWSHQVFLYCHLWRGVHMALTTVCKLIFTEARFKKLEKRWEQRRGRLRATVPSHLL